MVDLLGHRNPGPHSTFSEGSGQKNPAGQSTSLLADSAAQYEPVVHGVGLEDAVSQ